HRLEIAARLVDRRMDEALRRQLAVLAAQRRAVGAELDDVSGNHGARADRAGQKETFRIGWMPGADVAEGVDDAEIVEDAVGDHQVFDRAVSGAHVNGTLGSATVVSAEAAGNLRTAGLLLVAAGASVQ